MRHTRLAIALVVLTGCGGFDLGIPAPASPSTQPTPPNPTASSSVDTDPEGSFELDTPSEEVARAKMSARCPNGYVVELQEVTHDGNGPNDHIGHGKAALPPTPHEGLHVRYHCERP